MGDDLLVLVPSRGRPKNVLDLQEAIQGTAEGNVDVIFGFDDDDETRHELALACLHDTGPRLGLVGTLNAMALKYADEYQYIGFMGDDHRPRTDAWDIQMVRALRTLRHGIAYGNDLFQGPALPTAVFMTSSIIKTLGYMAPPVLRHLYVDNIWKTWGEGMGALIYLPEVIIEHLHPQAGKSEWDDSYTENNGGERWEQDGEAWAAYTADHLWNDLAKLKHLRP